MPSTAVGTGHLTATTVTMKDGTQIKDRINADLFAFIQA